MNFEDIACLLNRLRNESDCVFYALNRQISMVENAIQIVPEIQSYIQFNEEQKRIRNSIEVGLSEILDAARLGRFRDAAEYATICSHRVNEIMELMQVTEFIGEDHRMVIKNHLVALNEFQSLLRWFVNALSD